MNVKITPCTLDGDVVAPPSKSAAHRALLCAALAKKKSRIELSSVSKDIEATLRCVEAAGGRALKQDNGYEITPVFSGGADKPAECRVKKAVFDCGESGSTLRFFLPVAAALGIEATFVGSGRLPDRPVGELLAALKGCNASADKLPLTISGRLQSGVFRLRGDISSQYVTGLLFALPLLEGDSEIVLTTPLESASYVELTLRALADSGIAVERTESGFFVRGGQVYRPKETICVEGDWSNAAFFITASAIGNLVRVRGVDGGSAQGDAAIKNVLLSLRSSGAEIDAGDIPDLVPIVSVAAAYATGRTVIKNAARLRIKECDRLHAVAVNLNALGGKVQETNDGLIIDGTGGLTGGKVDGFNDHRIVMSMAIAATKAAGAVEISGAEAVEKSYPAFFEEFKRLGGKIDVL